MTAFAQAELLAAEHAGPGSLLVAFARANRGTVLLTQGDLAGADVLLQQALALASPRGQPHGPVWASIARAAAQSARRQGDLVRADRLDAEAARLLPTRSAPRQIWL